MRPQFFPRLAGTIRAVILVIFVFPIAHAQVPTVEDVEYGTACGPISCFAALKSLGVESSLEEVINRCQWTKDTYTPLEDLRDALNSYNSVECDLGKISPQKLCELLEDDQTAVVLAVRKDNEQVDHAVCALDVDENGQIIKLFDYPGLNRTVLIGDLASRWDGLALVVRRSSLYRAADKFAYFFSPFVLALLGLQWLRSRMSPSTTSDADAKSSSEKDAQ